MIIDKQIKSLVENIEQSPNGSDTIVRELVGHLAHNCAQPDNQDRYRNDPALQGGLESYPLDSEGYAVAFVRWKMRTRLSMRGGGTGLSSAREFFRPHSATRPLSISRDGSTPSVRASAI